MGFLGFRRSCLLFLVSGIKFLLSLSFAKTLGLLAGGGGRVVSKVSGLGLLAGFRNAE